LLTPIGCEGGTDSDSDRMGVSGSVACTILFVVKLVREFEHRFGDTSQLRLECLRT
jgi:hypothetical protein